MAKKSKAPPRAMAQSKAALAVALGKSLPMLDRYVAKGLPIVGPPYDVEAAREWIRENVRPRPGRSAEGEGEPIARKRIRIELRKIREEWIAKRLKNELARGRLLQADEVRQWVSAAFIRIRERLESLVNELQVLVPSAMRADFRARCERLIHNVLQEMADWETQLNTPQGAALDPK